jgi:hypothetical protein
VGRCGAPPPALPLLPQRGKSAAVEVEVEVAAACVAAALPPRGPGAVCVLTPVFRFPEPCRAEPAGGRARGCVLQRVGGAAGACLPALS